MPQTGSAIRVGSPMLMMLGATDALIIFSYAPGLLLTAIDPNWRTGVKTGIFIYYAGNAIYAG